MVTDRVLVTGGAGYIGSHMVRALLDAGREVLSYDSLVTGYRDAVSGGDFVCGDLADARRLDEVLGNHRVDAVMHFASFIQVGESVRQPGRYYANNLANAINLLSAMARHRVRKFIFSSTAAVYGEPGQVPIPESHPTRPINPYGRAKWMVEQALPDFEAAHGIRSVALRYFNAAGADPQARLGERHEPETHLIPLVLRAAAGRSAGISVFGRDYDTPDGTCIRDYVHVVDLCQAHLLALDHLDRGGASDAFNLGNGNGHSVQQVIDACRAVTGRPIPVIDAPRRAGDPARLVADSAKARRVLGWSPARADLATIVEDAWRWDCRHHGLPVD